MEIPALRGLLTKYAESTFYNVLPSKSAPCAAQFASWDDPSFSGIGVKAYCLIYQSSRHILAFNDSRPLGIVPAGDDRMNIEH